MDALIGFVVTWGFVGTLVLLLSGAIWRSPEAESGSFSWGGFLSAAAVLVVVGLALLASSHNVSLSALLGEVQR